jgi:type II secretory pathway pseudopilin PulG
MRRLAGTDPGSENGFALLELIVVMAIIIILMGLGVLGIQNARSTGSLALAISTARAYEQAIDRFAAAHGGRVPAVGTDWPTTAEGAARGPVADVMGTKRFFMRSVPESVQSDRVLVGVGTAPTAPAGESTITYLIDGTGYRIEIRARNRPPCAVYGLGGAQNGSEPTPC